MLLLTGFAVGVVGVGERTYDVQMVSRGDPGNIKPDVYYFRDDLLKTDYFSSFGEARVIVRQSSGATLFSAETRQTKLGKIKWIGAVAGDKLETTIIWYKVGSNPLLYTAKGYLKKSMQEKE
jgi:hypothetical protein